MKRSILIIENNDTLLSVYREWMALIGYQVQLVNTMLAAEDSLDNRRYHAVIYDIDVAGTNGIDFLRDHWLQFQIEGIRVVVVSRDEQLRHECESMGIPFFTRPVRMRELEQIIVGLMKAEARPASTRPVAALTQ